MPDTSGVMVVTGASTGVGRAVCLRFAAEGFRVCALARSLDKLGVLATEAEGEVYPYRLDVTDSDAVGEVFQQIVADHGRVDVLVNNAGVTSSRENVDAALIDRIIDTNLKGTLYCSFAALPTMKAQQVGRIINVASIAGYDIAPAGGNGLYAASKFGVMAFTESLGKAVRRDGILVTGLCPGGIDTPLWSGDNSYPFAKSAMIRPGEVADLIAYVLAQPRRTLFKNIVFVSTVEQW